MGATVTFDFTKWLTRYPEFSNVLEGQAQEFFDEATLYHQNDGGGPIDDAPTQLRLLNMLTAHIAMLSVGTEAAPASGLVGRISAATQGSVSVTVGISGDASAGGTRAWFEQTPYGLSYWQATAAIRTAHYIRGTNRRFSPAWLRNG